MLGLILAGAQVGFGAYQYIKGQAEMNNLKRPTYEIPSEVKANLTKAQLNALEGLPEAQKKAYVSQIQQSAGAANNRVSGMKAGLEGMAGVYQNQINSFQQLLGQDAMAKRQNEQVLTQQRQQMAGYKDKAFEVNQMQPYKQEYNQAQAMMGAGLQNAMGGLQQGAASFDKSQALNAQLDYYKSLNPSAKTSGSFGGNYTSPNQMPGQIPNNGQVYGSPSWNSQMTPITQNQWDQGMQANQVGMNNLYGAGQIPPEEDWFNQTNRNNAPIFR